MALPSSFLEYLKGGLDEDGGSGPKRGEAIFEGTDYPRDWDGFVGQAKAKEQLMVAAASAKARGARLDHTLIASGIAGVGKSTLATLLAYQADVGLVRASGPMTMEEAKQVMQGMNDGDALFIDEAHLLTNGNKNKADWILPYMTEGKLYTARGAVDVPDVTIIAATTDVGKLPETLISRFMIQPTIVQYTDDEGAGIAASLAGRMSVENLQPDALDIIARAADCNPRIMRQILTQIRDLGYAYPATFPNIDKALEWAGVSRDGLSKIAREILLLLRVATNNTASLESLRANLGEPGPIGYHEKQLLQRGLIEVTGRGRTLTERGIQRAREEALTLLEN